MELRSGFEFKVSYRHVVGLKSRRRRKLKRGNTGVPIYELACTGYNTTRKKLGNQRKGYQHRVMQPGKQHDTDRPGRVYTVVYIATRIAEEGVKGE